ncbi:site-specific integrase [Helicobacter pylori]|nr:site-specific integrase [Helicobacter pylori]WQX92224.1 site-specific integrase [Helicobacter pylori]
MSDCKMSRVSRELFNNIKSFLHHKLKAMIRIQSVNDLQLVLKWQDRVLECQSLIALKELNRKLYNQGIRHTIMMQGLFLFFDYFCKHLKVKRLRLLNEEMLVNFLFELAKQRKINSMAKYVMYIRQFFDYLDRTKHYEFYFSLKNIAFAKHRDNLPKHLNSKDLKSFIYTLINYRTRSSYEKRNKCILLLIILGGLRKSEVFNLELRNIVLEKEHYILLIKGKNNKERKAFIKREMLEKSLDEWLSDSKRLSSFNGRFVFKKSLSNYTQKHCSISNFVLKIFMLSGIENFKQYGTGLHLFRHSFATLVYAKSRDIVLTSRALGHQSLSSTKIYIHTAQEYNKQVASIFDNLLSG